LVAAGADVAGMMPKARTPASAAPTTRFTKHSSHMNPEWFHRV